jgi:hypothetical protein
LVAFGEMGFSGRMPGGKAAAEVMALMAELRGLGWLPASSVKTQAFKTKDVLKAKNTVAAGAAL